MKPQQRQPWKVALLIGIVSWAISCLALVFLLFLRLNLRDSTVEIAGWLSILLAFDIFAAFIFILPFWSGGTGRGLWPRILAQAAAALGAQSLLLITEVTPEIAVAPPLIVLAPAICWATFLVITKGPPIQIGQGLPNEKRARFLQRFLIFALACMFLSTMPGHLLEEEILRSLGGGYGRPHYDDWYDMQGIHHEEPNALSYGGSPLITLIVLLLWPFAYGFFVAKAKSRSHSENIKRAAIAFAILLAGKFVDLTWENQIFTGNYWAFASLLCLLLPWRTVPRQAANHQEPR